LLRGGDQRRIRHGSILAHGGRDIC
jgi:hypothetical protein